jgi:hypothetical protein
MDDSHAMGRHVSVIGNRFLTEFFVFWIVQGLSQKWRGWLHQKVAEKRATPVVR